MDEAPDAAADVTLRILRVGARPGPVAGGLEILLETTGGSLQGVFHPVEGGTNAVVCASGAMGGLDGPAAGLYGRLAGSLAADGISTFRVDYRQPNVFEQCVADVLIACSFLRGIGAVGLALVGHSFGAAVVIKAGELAPAAVAVVALSPQLYGTREVHLLQRPLLLVHGAEDTVLAPEASEDIYRRAADPKQLVLYEGTGHALLEPGARLDALVVGWLRDRFAGLPMQSGRVEEVL
jgi:dienelactone hydrolase